MVSRLQASRNRRFRRLALERLEDRITPAVYIPTQIRHAYGFDQVAAVNGAPLTGAGQTIAIVDAFYDPNAASDLATFDSTYSLPAFNQPGGPTFQQVSQTGGSPTSLTQNSGWGGETVLDIEWAHAIAPSANILLVEASSNSNTNLFAAVAYARSQPGVSVVSMSWGGSEFSSETGAPYTADLSTPSGHAGVAFVASSGDGGAGTIFPAISPRVLSVGGTTLNLSNGNYGSETAWSGSGGGASKYFSKPSYQTAYSGTQRGGPDVAYDANPNTGFSVYNTYDGGFEQIGGTSAGAPQWAALIALVDQGRSILGLGTLDGASQLLPAIYAMPSTDFHDITSGSNGTNSTASTGYDLVTGRGSPLAPLVIRDLIAYGTTAPTVTTSPLSRSLTVGQTASFTAAASGTPAPSIQWQISTDGGATFINIGGATSAIYSFTPTLADSGDLIRAVFTSVAGSVTTTAASLVVAAPVSVVAVQINDGSDQRSEVRSISITFSGPVNFAGNNAAAAFQLLHIQSGMNVVLNPVISSDSQGRTVVTLFFSGSETDPDSVLNGGIASLADGQYTLTVLAGSITDSNGVALDGDGNGVAGGDYVSPPDTAGGGAGQLRLYRLFGDVNGDGFVDAFDLGVLRGTINASAGTMGYLAYLDGNGDGTVDALDLNLIRGRINTNVFGV
jgi:subtilase family serine protease